MQHHEQSVDQTLILSHGGKDVPLEPATPARGKRALSMRLVAAIAAICGGLYGYDTGIVSGALLSMTQEFHLSHTMQETVTAAILAGAVIGALGTSWLSERLGRRITIMIVAAIFALGSLACALAPGLAALIAGRVFLGLAVGGSTQVVPMYISELAPSHLRGHFVTMFNVAIGIGIVLANVVGFAMHDIWSWRPMVAIATVPAVMVFAAMFVMPRSPRWVAEKHGLAQAADILFSLRSTDKEAFRELRDIEKLVRQSKGQGSGWRGMRQAWLRPALIAALGVAFFTQCGGLEMMIYYAPTFLSDVGFGSSSALLASLGVALTYALTTLWACIYVDRIGRRRLMLIMIPGSIVSLIGLGAMFASGAHGGFAGWLTIVFLLAFMFFNSAGIQACGWLLGSEMFPLAMRGPASALHAATLWGSNLLVTGTALTLAHAVGLETMMWIYAGINLLSLVFVFRCVPETAGASLEDIETALRRDQFHPAKGVALAGLAGAKGADTRSTRQQTMATA